MALSRHAQRADERPLLGAKRKLTNGCLPISIMSTGASPLTRLDCLLCRDPRHTHGTLAPIPPLGPIAWGKYNAKSLVRDPARCLWEPLGKRVGKRKIGPADFNC